MMPENGEPKRALSLNQPWAELVVSGAKTIETRRWRTQFRGPFYIHGSKRRNAAIDWDIDHMLGDKILLPFGALVGTANLVDVKTYRTPEEFAIDKNLHLVNFDNPIDFGTVRYGFILKDVRRLPQPIPCKGMLNFFIPRTKP